MSEKPCKTVLVVDDDTAWHTVFRDCFGQSGARDDCPYRFEVDTASSAAQGVAAIRAKRCKGFKYDVIVLDIRMEGETSGIVLGFRVAGELRDDVPVLIVFTGYPTYETCVQAVRFGAWDYIVKADQGNRPAAQVVVDSVLDRLRELDLRHELERRIAAEWLTAHYNELQESYSGEVVALWHEPVINVIASGHDTFELEASLEEWRSHHASWQQPLLVRITPTD